MSTERYSHIESRKREGAHYTPGIFSDFISEKILKSASLTTPLKIVDPAVGDGELLISLIRNLHKHGISEIKAYGFETNHTSTEIARKRLEDTYPNINLTLQNRDFLEVCMEKGGIFGSKDIFDDDEVPIFDLLIANPPYIRTQVLGAKTARALGKNFGLNGRIDMYQAFLVAMKAVLGPSSVAGVIVSNRFLTTRGSGKLREMLFDQYEIKGIWDFGDTKVFDAAVLPAVMLLSPRSKNDKNSHKIPFQSVYELTNGNSKGCPNVNNQIEALKYRGIVNSGNSQYRVKHGYLTFDSRPSDLWRLQDQESKKWLKKVEKETWCTFKDIGKVRVGVKTTADNVFIRSDWSKDIGYKPELLKPLTTHHVAGRFKASDKNLKYILYTHEVKNGRRSAINLSKYPLSKKYLEGYRKQLASRDYVAKAKRNWYEIWVPQNPALWLEEKIVFRDISEHPNFWMDLEQTVVNGDCYWMLKDNKSMPKDILWLALSIANSEFIEEFYDIKFQNKLYSNRRRFMSQYVEQFPIPNPERKQSLELVDLAKKCYGEAKLENRKKIEKDINELVWSIFNVTRI